MTTFLGGSQTNWPQQQSTENSAVATPRAAHPHAIITSYPFHQAHTRVAEPDLPSPQPLFSQETMDVDDDPGRMTPTHELQFMLQNKCTLKRKIPEPRNDPLGKKSCPHGWDNSAPIHSSAYSEGFSPLNPTPVMPGGEVWGQPISNGFVNDQQRTLARPANCFLQKQQQQQQHYMSQCQQDYQSLDNTQQQLYYPQQQQCVSVPVSPQQYSQHQANLFFRPWEAYPYRQVSSSVRR